MTKRMLRVLGLLLALLVPATLFAGTTITVLHVNDSHSHLEPFGPKDEHLAGTIGGLTKAATVIGTVRASEPNVLLLHAGDAFHGDFFFNTYYGVPELALLQQLGLDAMAVGNHEFDFGPDFLAMVLSSVPGLPLSSANLSIPAGHPLTGMIQPTVIREVAGVRVGIFGMTVPTDPTTRPAPVVIRSDVAPAAGAAVAALRAQGVDVVIMLSHLGLAYDQAVAANVPGIDFIVGGHNHFSITRPIPVTNPAGRQTLIVQAGEFYDFVGKLSFTVEDGNVTFGAYELLDVDEDVAPAPEVKAVVDALKPGIVARYGDVYQTVLGFAREDILRTYDPDRDKRDTGAGNLLTDAMRRKTRTEIALAATGLIGDSLYAGPLVGADIFRTASYGYDTATGLGFKLVTLEMLGSELLKGMEICLTYAGLTDTFDLQFSGLRYRYDSRRPPLQRVLLPSVRIQGRPIDPARKYTLTVNEGIAYLLPAMGVQAENVRVLPDLEYNVLKDYVVELGHLDYDSQGRVRDVAARTLRHHPPRVKAEMPERPGHLPMR